MTDAQRKVLAGAVEKAIEERQVRVVVSTADPDRYGDIVVAEGVDLTKYRTNPVVLWMHNHELPIARCVDIGVVRNRIEALVQFPPEGSDEDSDRIYGKIKAGIVNAASIGFLPGEWSWIEDGGKKFGRRFITSELIEFSFVGVPANAEALILERALDTEEKAGRVISAVNETKLRNAHAAIGEVLSQVEPDAAAADEAAPRNADVTRSSPAPEDAEDEDRRDAEIRQLEVDAIAAAAA